MGKIAFVFSGQGAQYQGMGKQLYQVSNAARAVFDMADRVRPGTSFQCFNASKKELCQTINTQPCLFCVGLAAAEALLENHIHANMTAGFSLGEIPALAFCKMLSYKDAFRLVVKRAELMQKASEKTGGAMGAVLGLPPETVEQICKSIDAVYPVNYNCPNQIVISAQAQSFDDACEKLKSAGGKVLKLAVGGPFHTPFMEDASQALWDYIQAFDVNQPQIPIYSNVTALPYKDKSQIALQIKSPVLWQNTIENMIAAGADTFIEVGAGRVLSGLIKKISSTVKIYNVEDEKSLSKTLEGLKC